MISDVTSNETSAAVRGASNGEEGKWWPIETAPKDGTKVLVGCFQRASKRFGRVEADWWRTREDEAGFIGFGRFNAEHYPPTHWMPIPAPPPSCGPQEVRR